MKKQQIQTQEQVQVTAFQKQTTYNMLYMTLEWLEKYIEVAYGDYFPNWQNQKQIHDDNIKRTDIDGNPTMAEDSLSTHLLLFRSTLSTKPPFLREEIKQEYYKWISATEIDVNNCPERLKHFLFGICEIMEGRGGKIIEDLKNRQTSARLDDYDQRTGRLNFERNAIYQANRFNQNEIAEIERALNTSQQSAQVQQPPYKWNF